MTDDDPGPEDLERFGHETAWCPECGAEIWDQAEFCPACGGQVGGRTLSRPPVDTWLGRRWWILVVVVVLAAFLAAVIF
ncbi:MAG: zinc-ribbon domain-containing protein [Planctomycetota bacterium]|jgi:hypothetical protein